jgi:endonuclease YncB( thermonuclease family)
MGNCATSPSVPTVPKDKHLEMTEEEELKILSSATYETAEEITYNFTKAKVIKVYDGDTFTIAAMYNNKLTKFSVRVFGVDCDEMKGGTDDTKRNARLAKVFVKRMILGKIINIDVLNNKIIDGVRIHEKFGRLLARVTIDGKNLGDELVNHNLARRYYGGNKDTTPLHPVVDFSLDGSERDSDGSAGDIIHQHVLPPKRGAKKVITDER